VICLHDVRLDHSDLVRGGEEIIRGGEIGQVLLPPGPAFPIRKIQESSSRCGRLVLNFSPEAKINETILLFIKTENSACSTAARRYGFLMHRASGSWDRK
jgi:hypothetical protein